ncbi:winged helix-turn-helix domain-containing protein [Streptomyces decoyicus]|uniref:winged helix-turn-helix domain-containing protein n=1 Tax=Streptomyces decoyicus TaxID=249567 RepID=UPI00386D733E
MELRPKEFDLLVQLAASAGRAVSREDLMSDVWDENWFGSTKTLDVHVAALRHKLGDRARITTLRHFGYRLEPPGEG